MRQVWDLTEDAPPHPPKPGSEFGPREPGAGGWQLPGARLPQVAQGSEVVAVGLLWLVPPAPRTADTQQGEEPRAEPVLNLFFFGNDRLPSGHSQDKG